MSAPSDHGLTPSSPAPQSCSPTPASASSPSHTVSDQPAEQAGRPLRVVYAGTPVFAAQALDALIGSRHEVVAVLSQPDRPAGRGQKLLPSAVKQRALAANLPVLQPESLRIRSAAADETEERRVRREAANQGAEEALAALRALQPDVMVVAAYGLLLPQLVLDLPRLGCLNIHASLLPRWRGAAPIQRAIEAGDAETGICIMQMEAGLDTGPVGARHVVPILETDTASTLHDRLADVGAQAIVAALDELSAGRLVFEPQAQAGVTYAAKVDKKELGIDWTRTATEVSRHIRAFDPPGAITWLEGHRDEPPLRVFQSQVLRNDGNAADAPGTIVAAGPDGVDVACGQGSIVRLAALQRAGGRRQPADAFLRGHPLSPGVRFISAGA